MRDVKKDKNEGFPLFLPIGPPLFGVPPVVFDPLGSYTGVPEDAKERPVQDADDL